MLSEYLKTIGEQTFEYVGDCWGNHHYTATAAQFADDVTAIGYDGPVIDHPARGGDSDGYYTQSGDIWQHNSGHGQELVLRRKRKHNPAWPDPPEARAKRQAKRLARLNEVAQSLGFETWRRLETAVLNGAAVVTRVQPPDSGEEGE